MATIFVPAKEWIADQAELAKKRAEEEARKVKERGAQLIVNATNAAQEKVDAAAAAKDATVDTMVESAFDKVRAGGEAFDNLGTAVHDKFQPPGGPENQPVAPEPTPPPQPTPTPTPQPTALPPAASPVTRRPEPPVSNVGPVIERGQPTPVTPTPEPTPEPVDEPDPTQQAQWGAQPAGFEPTPPEELKAPGQQQTPPVAPAPEEPPPPPPPVAPAPPTDTPAQFLGNLGGAIGDKFSGLGTAARTAADTLGGSVSQSQEAQRAMEEALRNQTAADKAITKEGIPSFQPPRPSTAVDGATPYFEQPTTGTPEGEATLDQMLDPSGRVKANREATNEAILQAPQTALREGLDPALEESAKFVAPTGPLKNTPLDVNLPGVPNYRRAAEAGINTVKQSSESIQENLHGIEGAQNVFKNPDATDAELQGAQAGQLARGASLVGDVVGAPFRAAGGAAMGQYFEDKPIEAATKAGIRPDTPVLGGLSNPVELGRFAGDIAAPDTIIDDAVGLVLETGMELTKPAVIGTLKAFRKLGKPGEDIVRKAVSEGAEGIARLVRSVGDRSGEVVDEAVATVGTPATERQAASMAGREGAGIPQPAANILPGQKMTLEADPDYSYVSANERELRRFVEGGFVPEGVTLHNDPALAQAAAPPTGTGKFGGGRPSLLRVRKDVVPGVDEEGRMAGTLSNRRFEVYGDDGEWHPVRNFTDRDDYGVPSEEAMLPKTPVTGEQLRERYDRFLKAKSDAGSTETFTPSIARMRAMTDEEFDRYLATLGERGAAGNTEEVGTAEAIMRSERGTEDQPFRTTARNAEDAMGLDESRDARKAFLIESGEFPPEKVNGMTDEEVDNLVPANLSDETNRNLWTEQMASYREARDQLLQQEGYDIGAMSDEEKGIALEQYWANKQAEEASNRAAQERLDAREAEWLDLKGDRSQPAEPGSVEEIARERVDEMEGLGLRAGDFSHLTRDQIGAMSRDEFDEMVDEVIDRHRRRTGEGWDRPPPDAGPMQEGEGALAADTVERDMRTRARNDADFQATENLPSEERAAYYRKRGLEATDPEDVGYYRLQEAEAEDLWNMDLEDETPEGVGSWPQKEWDDYLEYLRGKRLRADSDTPSNTAPGGRKYEDYEDDELPGLSPEDAAARGASFKSTGGVHGLEFDHLDDEQIGRMTARQLDQEVNDAIDRQLDRAQAHREGGEGPSSAVDDIDHPAGGEVPDDVQGRRDYADRRNWPVDHMSDEDIDSMGSDEFAQHVQDSIDEFQDAMRASDEAAENAPPPTEEELAATRRAMNRGLDRAQRGPASPEAMRAEVEELVQKMDDRLTAMGGDPSNAARARLINDILEEHGLYRADRAITEQQVESMSPENFKQVLEYLIDRRGARTDVPGAFDRALAQGTAPRDLPIPTSKSVNDNVKEFVQEGAELGLSRRIAAENAGLTTDHLTDDALDRMTIGGWNQELRRMIRDQFGPGRPGQPPVSRFTGEPGQAGATTPAEPSKFKLDATLSDFRNKSGDPKVQHFWDDVIQNAYNNTVYGGIAGGVAGGVTGDQNLTPEQRAARIVAGAALGGGVGGLGSIGGSYTLARLIDGGAVDARVLIPHPDTVDRAKAVMFALADAAKPGEMIEVPRSLRGLQEGERVMRGLPAGHDQDTMALREFFGPNFGIESKEAWLEKLKDWPATRAKKAIRDVIFDTLTGYKPDRVATASKLRSGESRADLLAAQADSAIRGIVPQQDMRSMAGLKPVVEKLAEALGIEAPTVTITPERSWTAAFMNPGGANPTGAVKISQYMLDRLPEDTIIGILAHELGHGKEDSMRVAAGGLSAYQMWERANQIADTNPLLRPFAGGGRTSDAPNTLTRPPTIEQPRAHIIPPEGQGGIEGPPPPPELRPEGGVEREIPSVAPVPEHNKAGRLTSLGDLDDPENFKRMFDEVTSGKRRITGEERNELQRALARHTGDSLVEGVQGRPAQLEAERLRQAQRRRERAQAQVQQAETEVQAAQRRASTAADGESRAAARADASAARAKRRAAQEEADAASDEIDEVEQTTTEGRQRTASTGQEPLDIPQMQGTGAQMPLAKTGDTPETAQATDAMDEARRIREQSASAEASRVEGERGGRIEERFADSEAGRQQYEALVNEHGEAAARAIWKQRYGSDVQSSFLPEVRETSSPRGLVEAPTPPPKGTADLDKPIKTEPGYVPDENLPAGQQSLDLDPLSQGTRRMQGTGPGQREPVAGTQRGLDTQKPPTPDEQQASDVQKMQEEATRSARQADAAVRQEGEATSEGIRTTEALDRQADLDAQRAEYEALVRQRGETVAKERMADKYPETWGVSPARQLDLIRGNKTEVSRQAKAGLGGAPGPSTGEQGLARDAAQTRLSTAVDARVKADRALYGDPNNPETSARAKMSEAQRAAAQAERRSLAIDNGDQAGDPAEANAAMLDARQKAKEARQAHQQAVTNLRLAEREVKDATRAVGTTNAPTVGEPPEGMDLLVTKGKAGKRNRPLAAPADPERVRKRDWLQSTRYSGMLSGVAGMVSDATSGILEQGWKLSTDTIRDLAGAATLRGGKPSAAAAEAMYMLHTAITQAMPAFMHEVTHPLRSGNAAESVISKSTKAHDAAVARVTARAAAENAASALEEGAGRAAIERALADARASGEIPEAGAGVSFFDRLLSNRQPTAEEGHSEVGRDIYRRLKQQNESRLKQIAAGTLEVPSRVRSGTDAVHNQVGYRADLAHQGAYRASQEGLQPFSREWFQSINKFIDGARDTPAETIKFGTPDVPMDTAGQRAQKAANEISFRGDPGDIGRLLTRMGSQPALNYLMPLVRTAYIINKKAIERTPVTGAPLLAVEALVRGGAWRDENFSERLLQLGMGGAMWAGMAAMADQGIITGSGPKDRETRQVMMAQGWRPYSVKVGDRYYNYSRIQPLAFPLASAAAWVEANKYADAGQDQATVLGDAVNNFALWGRDQTFLRSFGELYESMGPSVGETNGVNEGLSRTGANLAMGVTGPIMGSFTGGISSALDPYEREREDFDDQFAYRWPSTRQGLPVRKDIFGQPVENPGRGLGFISPWQAGPSLDQMNPALRDMRKYAGSQSAIEDHRITDAINAVEEYNSGGKINPTPQERRLYNRFIGRENIKYAEVMKTAREQAAREKAARR